MQAVLAEVVTDRTIWVEARKQQQSLTNFQNEIQPSTRHFYDALQDARAAFILECRKASPSKGVIRDDFDPARIAAIYKYYALAISVLIDERYFQGGFGFLPVVSQVAPQPTLCKDFIINPYRICLARYYQADTCLLMLSVLDDEQYHQLTAVAHNLEMSVLTETSNEGKLERAIALGAEVVSISSRDLRDSSVNLNRTRELAPKLRHSVTVIGKSDINTYTRVRELSHFVNGFLTNSVLMAHDDLNATVRWALLGESEVCGLTRGQDAKTAYDTGAIYGGLIFVATSPRCVNVEQTQEVMAAAPLQYAGVFRNHDIADVADKAKVLSLAAVQLHGNEDQLYINNLREALPAHVTIWKALSVGETLPTRDFQHVNKYVFDNGQGGSGQRFNWSLLNGQSLGNVLLAGGLGADSYMEAAQAGCAGLDPNSAIESQPGIKNACLLAPVFQALRAC